MNATDLCFTPATELGRLIRARSLSPVELADAVLDRIVAPWPAGPGSDQGPKTIAGRPTPSLFDRLRFTVMFNLTGQPAASVPCGFTSEGLPVALRVVGRWLADSTVLRAAAAFEALQPWTQRRPSV